MTEAPASANLISLFPTGILVSDLPELDNAALARSIRALQSDEVAAMP